VNDERQRAENEELEIHKPCLCATRRRKLSDVGVPAWHPTLFVSRYA
jgi:hypothetical protein